MRTVFLFSVVFLAFFAIYTVHFVSANDSDVDVDVDTDVDVDVSTSTEQEVHHEMEHEIDAINTYVDPIADQKKDSIQLIEARGFKGESHNITTSDQYILTMHRILPRTAPTNVRRPPVLLQHGMLDTSATWILNDVHESLGFMLVDAGYDVWMCNSRGNKYALKHTQLKSSQSEFWKFDFDAHAKIDLPSCVDHVLKHTAFPSLSLIGHSQGGMISLAAMSSVKEFSKKINYYVGLAPVTYMKSQRSELLGMMAKLKVDSALKLLPAAEFVPLPNLMNRLLGATCTVKPALCNDATGLLFGTSKQVDKSRMGLYMAHWPDRTSIQNMVHWIQNTRSGSFADMSGTAYNVKPATNVGMSIYYGTDDFLASPADVNTLVNNLKASGVTVASQQLPYSHMDFVWARDAARTLYPNIIAQIKTVVPAGANSAASAVPGSAVPPKPRFAAMRKQKGGQPIVN